MFQTQQQSKDTKKASDNTPKEAKTTGIDYRETLEGFGRAINLAPDPVQMKFKKEEKPVQGKGLTVNDEPALENEADVMGRKAALGHKLNVMGNTTMPNVAQKYSEGHSPNELAQTVHDSIKGFGTDENAIHDVLNHDSATLKQVLSTYNSSYNNISGKGMVQDIINDTSGRTLELALYQIKRAGISVPESNVDDNISIVKSGITSDKKNVNPGESVKYTMPDGFPSYAWYILNNPYSREVSDRNEAWYESAVPINEGPRKKEWAATWDYPGVHTVACRVKTNDNRIIYFEHEESVGSYAEEIPEEHVSYEIIAHQIAYKETKEEILAEKSTADLLKQWKYNLNDIKVINGVYGLNLTVIQPEAGSGKLPVVAFRGTSEFIDFIADLDHPGPGYYQYEKNKDLIAAVFNGLGQKAIVTGHSLGGALSQYAAVDFASKIQSVVTFQSPGINAGKAKEFNNMAPENKPDVTHHIANNDLVDLSGDKHIEGDIYLHHLKNALGPISAHTSFLFTSPNFKQFRELMQINDSYYKNTVGKDLFEDKFFIEKFKKHPNNIKKAIVESIRKQF